MSKQAFNDVSEKKWTRESLGDLAVYQNGNSFSKNQWSDEGYPIIRIQNLTGEQDEYNHFDGDLDEKYKVENGDILLAWSGTIDLFQWDGDDAALNQHIYRIDMEGGVNDIFFKFKLEEAIPRLIALSHGSTMKHVRKADLVNLDVKIPSDLDEQRKIASVLYNVDQAIQKTEEIIEQTQRIKKGLMQDIFTEGYYEHEEFEKHQIGPNKFELPEDWEFKELGKFIEEFIGGANLSPSDFTEKGVKVFPKGGVNDRGIAELDEDEKQYVSEDYAEENQKYLVDNDFLMTALRDLVPSGPNIGRIVEIPQGDEYLMAQGVYGLNIKEKKLNRHYLAHLSNSNFYRKRMKQIKVGSTQVHIRKPIFSSVNIPIPSKDEQKKIAEVCNSINDKIRLQKKQKKQLQRLKKGLMQDLLTGEVRTRDRDIEVVDAVKEVEG